MLSIAGYQSAFHLAATARWLLSIKLGYSTAKSRTCIHSNIEVLSLVKRHPDLPASVSKSVMSKGIPPSLLVAIHYIGGYLLEKPVEAEYFVKTFRHGVQFPDMYADPGQDPAIKLRERLIGVRTNRHNSADAATFKAAVHCWNLYSKRIPVSTFVVPQKPIAIEGLNINDI
jgi:hypothetical protein